MAFKGSKNEFEVVVTFANGVSLKTQASTAHYTNAAASRLARKGATNGEVSFGVVRDRESDLVVYTYPADYFTTYGANPHWWMQR